MKSALLLLVGFWAGSVLTFLVCLGASLHAFKDARRERQQP